MEWDQRKHRCRAKIEDQKIVKVDIKHIFLFSLAVFIALLGIMFLFPKEGIPLVGEAKIQYPEFSDVFLPEEKEEKVVTVKEIIQEEEQDVDEIDYEAIKLQDSLNQKKKEDSIRAWQLKLHYPDNDKTVLYNFFEKLDKVKTGKGRVRVLHYGDSQIEGDRITGYIRHKLQGRFGGYGPGVQIPNPLVHNFAIRQKFSDNWIRYTRYMYKDSTVNHRRYGMMGTFSRFTPIYPDSIRFMPDSLMPDSLKTFFASTKTAWLKFKSSTGRFPNTREYDHMTIFYGNNPGKVALEIYDGTELLKRDTLQRTFDMRTYSMNFAKTPKELHLKFIGKESPEFYGIDLRSNRGVIVDNIAWRGSSGNIFKLFDQSLLQGMFNNVSPDLIILEFGGNSIPNMKTAKGCIYYGDRFKRTIRKLQGMNPGVSIIVIGPSDMSYLDKTDWKTFPFLVNVRDELKKAAFETGAAYWDIYEAMGGEGSMPQWVDAKPPLAIKDHIHFNRTGARKVAQWFYNALIKDYMEYEVKTGKVKEENIDAIQ